MKLVLVPLIVLTLLVVGCQPDEIHPTTVNGELELLIIPESYTVEQQSYTEGFAGVEGTGEYNESIVFTVKNEVIMSGASDNMQLRTISAIKNELLEYADEMTPSSDVKDWGCYDYVQWGEKLVGVCFMRKELVSFSMLVSKGNHQDEILSWKILAEPQDN